MVSYSNYKRHLKNAHPSLNHDDEIALEDVADPSGGSGNVTATENGGNSASIGEGKMSNIICS